MMKKAADSKAKGKKHGSTCATCLVNSCQEKDAGVLFRLNVLFHQHIVGVNSES